MKKQKEKQEQKLIKNNDIDVEIQKHFDKKGGHFHIILEKISSIKKSLDKFVSVGLTTDKYKGKGNKNKKLKHSPFNDGKESYVKKQATIDYKYNYSSDKLRGKIDKEDYETIKKYGEKAKYKMKNNSNVKKRRNKKKKPRAK